MAIIKCKMCGGDLELVEGQNVATCEYCGTTQTVPTADSEKKMTLFGRANRLLRACEFDKAAGVFESIVAEFPEEAEAYWGLVLCKYGIEYVDDPATAKKIPTCHRSSFDSVLEDDDFEQAQENADVQARKVQWEEAKAIESLRQRIVEVSGKEAPYDIFICYKETAENGERTLDSVLAQDIYDTLTEKGYRVFFSRVTLEDKLGQEYEPYIFAALNSAKIMLAVGTDYEYYNAVWVKNEWSRFLQLIAAGQKKVLIPCFKNLDPYDMPKEFAKLQSQDLGKVGAMQDLLRGVEKIIPKNEPQVQPAAVHQTGPNVVSFLKRGQMFLEDKNWQSADEYFDKVLDIDPECAEAYLGKLLAAKGVKTLEGLGSYASPIESSNDFIRAMRYANEDLKARLKDIAGINEQYSARRKKLLELCRRRIFAGVLRTAAVMADGTVHEAGMWRQVKGKDPLSGYYDMIAVSGWSKHVAMIKHDGTVVVKGGDEANRVSVSEWKNITTVDTGFKTTVGLRADGTVAATGELTDLVSGWQDIVDVGVTGVVSPTAYGLRSDGTVLATEDGSSVYDWRDITAISVGNNHIAGLRADGTVVATGYGCKNGECDLSAWTDIVAVSAGAHHTVGLKADGTVVAVGNNDDGQCDVGGWRDIVAISAGATHTVGVRSDGRAVAVGGNKSGQCNIDDWKLFDSFDSLDEEIAQGHSLWIERKAREEEQKRMADEEAQRAAEEHRRVEEERRQLEEERRRAEEEAKKQAEKQKLEQERADLQKELANLKGMFSGKRRKEIEYKLAMIEQLLK